MTAERATGPFQTCGCCKRVWPTWDSFVLDQTVRLLGLQAVIIDPDFNVLVFEHRCGGSVSILTRRLRHSCPNRSRPTRLPGCWARTNAGGTAAAWRTWRRATRPAATRATVS